MTRSFWKHKTGPVCPCTSQRMGPVLLLESRAPLTLQPSAGWQETSLGLVGLIFSQGHCHPKTEAGQGELPALSDGFWPGRSSSFSAPQGSLHCDAGTSRARAQKPQAAAACTGMGRIPATKHLLIGMYLTAAVPSYASGGALLFQGSEPCPAGLGLP